MKDRIAYGIAVLFLLQAMSSALYVVQNDEEQKELQVPLFESSLSANNSSSPCGNNVNYTNLYAYAPYMVMENQSFTTSSYVYCEILGANMMLDYSIVDSSNSTVYSGNLSWTGTSSSSSNYTWNVSGLSPGYYTFHADLYVNGTYVDTDYDSFMVIANGSGGGGNNGGNNSGGNNSGGNTTTDTDGDGVSDSLDAFPMDANETSDYDGDGVGDNADTDDDNDGISDSADAFPTDSSETEDTDGDGVGNNADTDDDNDGVDDNLDAFPLYSSEAFDNDGDGVGDNADTDDDNDGVSDQEDAFPFDGGASNDTDADGVADAYDNCMTVFNPSQADSDMDGIGTECDADESTGNSGNNTGGNNTGGNNTMLDTDSDGIEDAIDNCQFVANLDQADADGDGIGTACDDDEITSSDEDDESSSSDDDESSSSDESDSVPSIGMLATSMCLLGAAVLVRRD